MYERTDPARLARRTGSATAPSACGPTDRVRSRTMLATLAAVVAGCTLVLARPADAAAQDWRTLTDARQRTGEEALDVEVEYGAGTLSLRPAESGVLYRARFRYDADAFEPELEYDAERGRLQVGMEGRRRGVNLDIDEGGSLDLALGPDVPIDLELSFGAVAADAEFGGVRLRSLEVATGASDAELRFSEPNPEPMRVARFSVGAAEFTATSLGNANAERIRFEGGVGDVTLDFTGEWRRDAEVEIDLGLGALTLRLPRGIGVRIVNDSFLASFDEQNMVRRGDSYYSEDWDDAAHRLTLNIDAVLSDIDVDWVAATPATAATAPKSR